MEKTYSDRLMFDSITNKFPFGKIEQIAEVGLVQKVDNAYVKDSVDCLIGYIPTNSNERKLLLCEMKAQVVSTTAQNERERVPCLLLEITY